MKRIFILIITTLLSLSLFGQNNFNYEIRAKGGLSIGNGQVKIDSIVKFGSTIKFFSLGGELTTGTSSDSISTNFESGTVLSFDSDDVTLTHSANTLTLGGGDLALGANNLTMTGSIASDASRVNHLYTDTLSVTNSTEGIALADSTGTGRGSYVTGMDHQTDFGIANAVNFTLCIEPATLTSPADNTIYYYGSMSSTLGLENLAGRRQYTIPFNCTLVGYSLATRSTAACTAETGTLYVRVNNTTDITLSDAITWGVGGAYTVNYFSSGALDGDINAGDKIEIKLLTPTWETDPTNMYMSTVLYFKNR